MVFFITLLRALAACLITNAHYTGIYPTDLIANGGLLGDVLFFAISGYCLFNVKNNFISWYGKRLIRIYPPVLLITVIYFLTGHYTFIEHNFLWWFIYPTYYHFVASIVLLYIPFYIVMKIKILAERLPLVMLAVFCIQLVIYLFAYDKSYYHIDNVYEYMIRFLFFNAMLIGAYVKQNDCKFRNKSKVINLIFAVVLLFVYFASKMLFAKYSVIASLQILNQLVLLGLLYFVFISLAGVDEKLNNMPGPLKKVTEFIAAHTLEIYLVQYAIIPRVNVLSFPINWFIITACIALAAVALHFVSQKAIKLIEKCIKVY